MFGITTFLRGFKAPKNYLAKSTECNWIYVLVDPRNGEVRYVGQSRSTIRRNAAHRAARTSSINVETNLCRNRASDATVFWRGARCRNQPSTQYHPVGANAGHFQAAFGRGVRRLSVR